MIKLKSNFVTPALFLIPAIITGCFAVIYARIIEKTLFLYHFYCHSHSALFLIITPLCFILAAFLVKKFAPEAGGSGIPQILHAIHTSTNDGAFLKNINHVSLRTIIVKLLSSTIGTLGGASIGREGPTVQISSSIFCQVAKFAQKRGYTVDYRSFLIAGGSAGVAAAFNAPLAGITFAIEEIAEGFFFKFKQIVMVAVIVAGVTSEVIMGDYPYFGYPSVTKPSWFIIPEALLIGIVCGLAGAFFAFLLSTKWIDKIVPTKWWIRALYCGIVCGLFGYFSQSESGGAGYESVKNFMNSNGTLTPYFALERFVTTIFSYISGMAGGIFAPCLSIGAGFGYLVEILFSFNTPKICAMIGMVAFFSAVVHAPLTSVMIVMEMTDEHILIIPFLIGAYLSHAISKFFVPVPLYRKLAKIPHENDPHTHT